MYGRVGPGTRARARVDVFVHVIEDKRDGTIVAGRDHMGKIPCYIAHGKDGSVWFSSEMKTLVDDPESRDTRSFPRALLRQKAGRDGGHVHALVRPGVGG